MTVTDCPVRSSPDMLGAALADSPGAMLDAGLSAATVAAGDGVTLPVAQAETASATAANAETARTHVMWLCAVTPRPSLLAPVLAVSVAALGAMCIA